MPLPATKVEPVEKLFRRQSLLPDTSCRKDCPPGQELPLRQAGCHSPLNPKRHKEEFLSMSPPAKKLGLTQKPSRNHKECSQHRRYHRRRLFHKDFLLYQQPKSQMDSRHPPPVIL